MPNRFAPVHKTRKVRWVMRTLSRKRRIVAVMGMAIAALVVVLLACGDDEKDKKDNTPQVVGCDQVKYQGYTYTISGCQPGVASFDVTTNQNGHTASFHITCSSGCIASATVSSGPTGPITAP